MDLHRVTVFGSSTPRPGTPAWDQAYRVGHMVARHGLELVNGGYTGTMEASARGAREAGGTAGGVTVRTFTYAEPNPYLSWRMDAPDLLHRLSVLLELGDLFVVLPGGTGTLVELALAWEFLNKGVSGKSILADGVWRPVQDALVPEVRPGLPWPADAAPPARDGLFFCEDVAVALDRFLASRAGA